MGRKRGRSESEWPEQESPGEDKWQVWRRWVKKVVKGSKVGNRVKVGV